MAHGETVAAPEVGLHLVVHAGHAALAGVDLVRDDFNHGRMFDAPTDLSAPIVWSVEGTMPEPLTDYELEALRLKSLGMNREEVGKQMYKSESTVKSYLGKVFKKLNAEGAPDAVAKGTILGLLDPREGGSLFVEPLTSRMLQILVLATLGCENEEIGTRLPGRPALPTVRTHLSRAMDRIGVRNRVEIFPRLLELGVFAMQAPGMVGAPEQMSPALALVDVAAREDDVA